MKKTKKRSIENLISIMETSERLGVTYQAVRNLISQGKLRSERVGGHPVVDAESVAERIQEVQKRRRQRRQRPM